MKKIAKHVLVGVKYCGGCNERYDRMGTFRRIISECSTYADFEPVAGREDKEFDLVLILCGCQAQCPDITKLQSRYGLLSLYQDTNPQKIVQKIHEIKMLHECKEGMYNKKGETNNVNV